MLFTTETSIGLYEPLQLSTVPLGHGVACSANVVAIDEHVGNSALFCHVPQMLLNVGTITVLVQLNLGIKQSN